MSVSLHKVKTHASTARISSKNFHKVNVPMKLQHISIDAVLFGLVLLVVLNRNSLNHLQLALKPQKGWGADPLGGKKPARNFRLSTNLTNSFLLIRSLSAVT